MASNAQGLPSDEDLRKKYGMAGGMGKKMNPILAKRMNGGQPKHFDSADWQMNKKGAGPDPTGQKPIYMGADRTGGAPPARQTAPAASLGFKQPFRPPFPEQQRKSHLAAQPQTQPEQK